MLSYKYYFKRSEYTIFRKVQITEVLSHLAILVKIIKSDSLMKHSICLAFLVTLPIEIL